MESIPCFSTKECAQIIRLSSILPLVPRDKNNTSHLGYHQNISYHSYNIENNNETNWIFLRFREYLKQVHKFEILKDLDIIHLHKYLKGDQFTKHRDMYYPNQILNIGAVLNSEYDGGEFFLYEPKEIIPKDVGAIYSFKNSRLHEVKRVNEGVRWSIIGFVLTDHIKVDSPLF